MATESASLIPVITAAISAILGGGVIAGIITFILNKPKTKAEIDRMEAETNKLRTETDKLRNEMVSRLKDAEDRLDWTEEAVRKIVAYTPGHFAHQALCQIRDKADEYYKDSNWHKKRRLLLLDNGYLQPPPGASEVLFTEEQEKLNKRLFEIAALTPMAKLLLRLREEVSRVPTSE
jgi:hypothetical protein